MTLYIIQNDNEEYVAAIGNAKVSWTTLPECAKTFVSREKALAAVRKINYRYNGDRCWVAKVLRD